jgi:hypothetical protein
MTTKGQESSPTSESVVTDEGSGINGVGDTMDENDKDTADMTKLGKKKQQSKNGSGYTSLEPHNQDVLLGRGKPVSIIQLSEGRFSIAIATSILIPMLHCVFNAFYFSTVSFSVLFMSDSIPSRKSTHAKSNTILS